MTPGLLLACFLWLFITLPLATFVSSAIKEKTIRIK
jgi:hypothetical protein